MKNSNYETCIICGKLTNIPVDTYIEYRYGYVEGAGQCCRECYLGGNKDIITLPVKMVQNTPNNEELGAKVRDLYWDLLNTQPDKHT